MQVDGPRASRSGYVSQTGLSGAWRVAGESLEAVNATATQARRATRQRVNAELARLAADAWTFLVACSVDGT